MDLDVIKLPTSLVELHVGGFMHIPVLTNILPIIVDTQHCVCSKLKLTYRAEITAPALSSRYVCFRQGSRPGYCPATEQSAWCS